MRNLVKLLLTMGVLGSVYGAHAQNPETQNASLRAESATTRFYQLNFVIREVEDERVINSRAYSMMVHDTDRASLRAGEKVPYTSASGGSGNVWQQIDVGVQLDCEKLHEAGSQVSLRVGADISSVVESHGESNAPASVPVLRSNRWDSYVVLPMKQPTVIFSSDDPASKRRMQLQLTVTPLR